MPTQVLRNPAELMDWVGKEIGVSEWLPMTQQRIQQFADATADHQWIHIDSERAKTESPFGGVIAHGFLTLSLVSHFLQEVLQIQSGAQFVVNYGLNRVRFPAPVLAGSNIRGRVSLLSARQESTFTEAIFTIAIENDRSEKLCCVAEWIVRYYK